jgi:hypothetical protein
MSNFANNSNKSSYIKQFVMSSSSSLANWIYKNTTDKKYITPINSDMDVLIETNLVLNGSLITLSDIKLKENIENISNEVINNILLLSPKKYNYKIDAKTQHYGLIAQELELIYPTLVHSTGDIKMINYIELIPVLIAKMKIMQDDIDVLHQRLNPSSSV